VIAAILAGGPSARFGGAPKGLHTVGGVRIIDRVASALRAVADEVVVVSRSPDAPAWLPGVRVVGDVRADRASLVGIYSALEAAGGSVLVAAWDMPFVTPALVRLIHERAATATHAVIPEGANGPEPCCAWYAPACLPTMAEMLAEGELRLGRLASRLPSCDVVARADVECVGDPVRLFFNVNTPADLARAEAIAASEH
jgi:molybdopterin-guanine dinucleotide biosynthesis protein A